jgi:radical SAM protein with 4Fe4S-binding SPASM domain
MIETSSLKELEKPWIINLELSNACNLECVFCDHPIFKKKMDIREIDDSLLSKIFSDVRVYLDNEGINGKIYELGLVGLGEPTLDKNFKRHIELINSYSHMFERISFNSNLVSLKQKHTETLLGSQINSYTFSVNASNRDTYRKMMGKDRFDLAIGNLKYFLSQHKRKHIEARVDIQLFESDESNLEELRAIFPSGLLSGVNLFSRKVYSKPVIQQNTGLLHLYTPNDPERYPCWDIYTRVYIDVAGNVYPCTIGNDSYRELSNLFLGNIKEESLFNLFNNRRNQEARERSEQGKLPYPECGECNVWSLTPNNFVWDRDRWTKKRKQVRAYGLKG